MTCRDGGPGGAAAHTGGSVPPARSLRIGHLNVRSLVPSIDDVNTLLDQQQLDLLCVSESWLRPEIDSSFLIFPGYGLVRRDRPGSGRGGGVCIIHRDTFRVETLSVPSTGSPLEMLWVSLSCAAVLTIGVVYRPPAAAAAAVMDDLHLQLTHVIGAGRPLFLLGDTNYDLARPLRSDTQRYSRTLHDLGLKQLVTGPTRPETGTLLDHVIVRETDDVTDVYVTPCSWSDHDMVVAETAVRRERVRRAEISVRSTRHLSPDSVCLDLLMADWAAVHTATDPSLKWAAWLSVWTPIIDRHMPVKVIRPRHPPCPWLTDNDDVRALMRERDLAHAAKIDRPSPETHAAYRTCRNRVRSAQYSAKSAFFLSSYRQSRKTAWKDIRRYLISPRGGLPAPAPRDNSDSSWADRLNQHFATVGPRVAAELERERRGTAPLPPRPPRVISGAFRVRAATLPELSDAIKRMSTSRACGEDGITIEMLRMTFPVVGPSLLNL